MLVTKTFKPTNGSRVHVLHETRTNRDHGVLIALCGAQTARTVDISINRSATCPKCVKYDNPFELSGAQNLKFWRVYKTPGNARVDNIDDLIKRDLINDVTLEPTERGHALAADLQQHPPWQDDDGVVHGRSALARSRAICGADLAGLNRMSFARLAKMHVVNKDIYISCLECMLEV